VKIAVLCPSRSRPDDLRRLSLSVHATSGADLLAYVDDDQRDLYSREDVIGRGGMYFGPRIGPVAAANEVVRLAPGYDVYGLVTDDSEFTTEGWDRHLEAAVSHLSPVWAASPAHNLGDNMDFAFVSAEWLRRLGWIAYPGCYHWCWPSVIEALGEAVGLVRLTPEQCFIQHHHSEPHNQEHSREDLRQFYAFFAYGRYPVALKALRATA